MTTFTDGPAISAPANSAFVVTDRSDYPPGATANISGGGFLAGETVTLQVLHADGTPATGQDHAPWLVVADASGAFQTTWHVCEDDCVGSTLQLSALGQTSGVSAQAFFTDAGPSVSFSPAANFAVGTSPSSVAVGDFNGDGKLDLAVANRISDNVSILLGTGTGSFSAATSFAVGSGPTSVAVGDFNGDGKPDLAVATPGIVSILLG
ncbi:MAG: VCBS repeat-containing protein, partial [Chloroflexi bacterium]|nr:VCBS repeat-containing protein [Chloroflexota bacterium]